jgi:hypothetical protein
VVEPQQTTCWLTQAANASGTNRSFSTRWSLVAISTSTSLLERTIMLRDIVQFVAELRWICGSIFGLVGAIATITLQRRKIVNGDRHAYTPASASSTMYTSILFAITRVLGVALQAVYHTRYRSSEAMRHIALQLYMRNMETLFA